MCRDAEQALNGLDPASPYRPAMLHAQGVAAMFAGDLQDADDLLARAYRKLRQAAWSRSFPS